MRPTRRLFTSLPTSAMPHSSVSTISYSCRALRFSATTLSAGLPSAWGAALRAEGRFGLGVDTL